MTVPHARTETPLFEILKADGILSSHRRSITRCPFCDFGDWDTDWHSADLAREVILDHYMNKVESAIIISECPKCHNMSWVHRGLEYLIWDTEDNENSPFDKQLVQEEIERRKHNAYTDWENSLCKTCKFLTKPPKHGTMYARVECEGYMADGMSGKRSGWVEESCKDYQKK